VAALTSTFNWMLATARQADGHVRAEQLVADIHGDERTLTFDDLNQALEWFEVERPNLVAAAQQAAATPDVPPHLAGQLIRSLTRFLDLRSHLADWEQLNKTLLDHARAYGDLAEQAQALHDLGGLAAHQFRNLEAIACLERSLAMRRQLDDRDGQARTLNSLGIVHFQLRKYDEAAAFYRESLALARALGNPAIEAVELGAIGEVFCEQGRLDEAEAYIRQANALSRSLGFRRSEGRGLTNLAEVWCKQDRYEEAIDAYEQSLNLLRQIGDRHWGGAAISLALAISTGGKAGTTRRSRTSPRPSRLSAIRVPPSMRPTPCGSWVLHSMSVGLPNRPLPTWRKPW